MKVGLIGFEGAGKSTLFAAVAGPEAKGRIATAPVCDERFDAIVAQIQPKKATPAGIAFHDDIEDMRGVGGAVLSPAFLDRARKMDVLLHVVRAFDSPAAHYHDNVDPQRDEERATLELVLADLQVAQSRLESLAKHLQSRSPGSQEYFERTVLERVASVLEEGQPASALDLNDKERKVCLDYQMLTARPIIAVQNVDEGRAGEEGCICAALEEQIAAMPPDDRTEFLAEYGLERPASESVVRQIYDSLGLITFYTAGPKETRAWSLTKGKTALEAADAIHSDIARGFIRAEVVGYDDWERAGSWDAAVASGQMRLEGKEYTVRDGDLLHIRNKS